MLKSDFLPMQILKTKLIIFVAILGILVMSFSTKILASASNSPQIDITPSNNTEKITATFPTAIQNGNIVDIEIYNASNTRVWQYFTTDGGTVFSATPPLLSSGTYWVSIGTFTPNWASNTAWYDHVATLNVTTSMSANASTVTVSSPTPPVTASMTVTPTLTEVPQVTATPTQISQISATPTQAPVQVSSGPVLTAAQTAYAQWKEKYVGWINSNTARIVRPENNNDTVSEGIGYGMLLSVYAKDQTTFAGLWNYGKKYLDSNGLMNWDIDSNGTVIGSGSATDADEDMAYALVKASALWPGQGYDTAAKTMIAAIKAHEVVSGYLNPGDNWGNTPIINPSYLAPSYYKVFADFTGDSQWSQIASDNSAWMMRAANASTGLLPDWLNQDLSQANISFDTHKNDFYYDALRTPIRLLMDYKATGDQNAQNILQKQSAFFASVGSDKLTSGYTMSGQAFSTYLDTAFLSGFAAAAQANPSSSFAQEMVNKLINYNASGYFGTSLRAITLFVIANNS